MAFELEPDNKATLNQVYLCKRAIMDYNTWLISHTNLLIFYIEFMSSVETKQKKFSPSPPLTYINFNYKEASSDTADIISWFHIFNDL